MKQVRLMADERKRLSSLANWKPQGHSVSQVRTAHFFISSALIVTFYEHIPILSQFVRFAATNTNEGE